MNAPQSKLAKILRNIQPANVRLFTVHFCTVEVRLGDEPLHMRTSSPLALLPTAAIIRKHDKHCQHPSLDDSFLSIGNVEHKNQ